MKQLEKTADIKRDFEGRLAENLKEGLRLESELPGMSNELKQFFTLIYKIQVIELENLELEEMNRLTDVVTQQKDLESEKLRLQIRLRDQMISEQQQLLISDSSGANRPEGWEERTHQQKPEGWEELPNSPAISPRRGSLPDSHQSNFVFQVVF